jgi:hypothetical protein
MITLLNEATTNPTMTAALTNNGGYGALEWPALLRKLDRQDASYRQ